jgi:hypothetical protein
MTDLVADAPPLVRTITFTLPFCLPSLNVRDRQHWSERHRQTVALNQEVMVAIGGPRHYPRPPFDRARVTVLRISAGELDPDNLVASLKSLLDVLKLRTERNPLGLSFIRGDEPGRCELVAKQQRGARKEGATVVRIEELR